MVRCVPDADLILRSGCVVVPSGAIPADVVVRGGVIVDVAGHASADAAEVIDAGGTPVLPGAVDSHVHVNEPGRTDWEGFATATRAAACGGVTTLVDMPLNSLPPTTTPDALASKRAAAASQIHVDVGFWGGLVPGDLGHLEALRAHGVVGFKVFLCDSGVDEYPPMDRRELTEAMRRIATLGGTLVVHAEDPDLLVAVQASADPRSHRTWLASRPPEAEEAAVAWLGDAAAATGCRVHVLHVSAAEAAAQIARAQSRGATLTGETCPHYLALADEELPAGATPAKCAPPIRDAANRERLWRHLADGALTLVASDHSPCPPALKHLDDGNMLAAWGGVSSLQVARSVLWTSARARGHHLAQLARWTSAEPARLTGLQRKGRIQIGCDADLVLFEPDARVVVDARDLQHRHPITPYDGATLEGRATQVWLRGQVVARDGEPVGAPQGHLLQPAPPSGTRRQSAKPAGTPDARPGVSR